MKRIFRGKMRKKPKEVLPSSKSPMNPKYQFALNEYKQTVPPTKSNDDGRSYIQPPVEEPLPTAEATERPDQRQPIVVETVKSDQDDIESVLVERRWSLRKDDTTARRGPSPYTSDQASIPFSLSQPSALDCLGPSASEEMGIKYRRVEPEMPDTTYEEQYGDAYVGAPIKYIYPSGYQSMRPRGGPWKLSIAICALFTWLSVFIVGHCSDRVDQSQQYYAGEIDDDNLVIETRWCGSRLLYIMWVASMMITGLAAAYCSVIGYIKVRDFAVANGRSQPPGMVGQTDYYVRIADDAGSVTGSITSSSPYRTTIYQADGTPQFWGGYIYRPTQAAVAVTSR
jgi:hypothetical protein